MKQFLKIFLRLVLFSSAFMSIFFIKAYGEVVPKVEENEAVVASCAKEYDVLETAKKARESAFANLNNREIEIIRDVLFEDKTEVTEEWEETVKAYESAVDIENSAIRAYNHCAKSNYPLIGIDPSLTDKGYGIKAVKDYNKAKIALGLASENLTKSLATLKSAIEGGTDEDIRDAQWCVQKNKESYYQLREEVNVAHKIVIEKIENLVNRLENNKEKEEFQKKIKELKQKTQENKPLIDIYPNAINFGIVGIEQLDMIRPPMQYIKLRNFGGQKLTGIEIKLPYFCELVEELKINELNFEEEVIVKIKIKENQTKGQYLGDIKIKSKEEKEISIPVKAVIAEQVADPIFRLQKLSRGWGADDITYRETFDSPKTLEIKCSTEGATIFYTINGGVKLIEYKEPIRIDRSVQIVAVAKKKDMADSNFIKGDYRIQTSKPTFNPNPGKYFSSQQIEIKCTTEDAKIYYTLDGSDPSYKGRQYKSPITVSETTTIKAIALVTKNGIENSETVTAVYTFGESMPSTPSTPSVPTSPTEPAEYKPVSLETSFNGKTYSIEGTEEALNGAVKLNVTMDEQGKTHMNFLTKRATK